MLSVKFGCSMTKNECLPVCCWMMPGHTCVVCGNTPSKDKDASFHGFPSDPVRRVSWLQAFGIDEDQLRSQSRVCSQHFRDGDAKKEPLTGLGKRFASP